MFVSGAFVLTDTLQRSFDSLFASVYSTTDVQVNQQSKLGEAYDGEDAAGDGIAPDVVAKVAQVPGVEKATGVVSSDGARMIGPNGKVVTTWGPPRLGNNWVDGDPRSEERRVGKECRS